MLRSRKCRARIDALQQCQCHRALQETSACHHVHTPLSWCFTETRIKAHALISSFRTPRSGDPEPSAFVFGSKKVTGLLAPSLALALRAACGARVCNPANAVPFSRELRLEIHAFGSDGDFSNRGSLLARS